jgi:hypothetical protein
MPCESRSGLPHGLQPLWLAVAMLGVCDTPGGLLAQTTPAAPAAQTAPQTVPPPALPSTDTGITPKSPIEMYKDAMHPLEVVRSSLDNWSNAELGALGAGMHMAAEDCAQTKQELFKGDDLYNLTRLCAFGQDWSGANTAALAYVASHEEEHRAQAYAVSVSALFHMGAVDLSVQTAREMLQQLPYDAEVPYALRDLKNSLVQASNPTSLPLAAEEHPNIVAALTQGVALKAAHGDAVMPLGTLYESAMQLAFLERYMGSDEAAATAVAEVESALPAAATLAAEDRQHVDAVTRRYRLLGERLPFVKILRALESPNAPPQIDLNFGSATVLVFFPDWCAECRNMMKTLTKFAVANHTTPIHAYGMVFADDAVVYGLAAHDANLKQFAGTQTLMVPDTTAQTLGATDYPLGIVLDSSGKVRFIGVLPADAFNGDGYVSKVIVSMVQVQQERAKDRSKGN